MITKIFLRQLLLTFFLGSGWIYLTVLAGLRFGSKTGGFIGGLPSTALLSFFFIGFTQSPEIASSVTTVFPIAIAISGLFLVVFATMARFGFISALFSGIFSWFLLSSVVILFRWENFILNLVIYAVVMLFAYIMLEKHLLIRSISTGNTGHPEKYMIIRCMFGGFIVMLTVLIAKTGGTVFGGIFAAFPAMFIATLTISYKAHGIEYSRAMTKPLMVTGMITVAVYTIALRYLYISSGLCFGTLFSICISAVSAYLTFRFILPKLK